MPNVSNEMNSPNYWINKTPNADNLILDGNGISAFNDKIIAIKETKVYDLKSSPETLSKEQLTAYINELPFPDEDRFIGDKKVSKEYYDTIRKNMITPPFRIAILYPTVLQSKELMLEPFLQKTLRSRC